MRPVRNIINNYSDNIISYSQAKLMLTVYLNNKNISLETFNNYIEELDGLEFTKEIESGF